MLGVNNTELGRFLGHRDGREVRRWLAGDSDIPVPTAKLLRLMAKLGLGPDDVV
jgi:crotonobetainyl-CoA:carnitine CoA-transferase CaiB-like acyl-CoA transferase